MTDALIELRNVSRSYLDAGAGFARPRRVVAVEDVTAAVFPGDVLGIVGESGCGKSTLIRMMLRLVWPEGGRVCWRNTDVTMLRESRLRPLRRHVQAVFQDPAGSLDPRMTVAQSLAEPLGIHEPGLRSDERAERVAGMLAAVGLDRSLLIRYPHMLSGGQCQRVAIARAMIIRPQVLICDEAVSALDVSIQAQIVALLTELARTSGVAIVFVSHNLAVVRQLCTRVMVMFRGRLVETAPAEALFSAPRHPYTRALLAATPVTDPERQRHRLVQLASAGETGAEVEPSGGGCSYLPRCPMASAGCRGMKPPLQDVGVRHAVACWNVDVHAPAGSG
ncbi:MAG: ATP-binding cassette domain-containing protein [Steroidobacteraceae bacterium]